MKVVLLFGIIALFSCTSKKVSLYEYKGVAVTRVDQGNKVYFYYGKYLDGNYPDSYIWTEYYGIDGAMNGFVIFKNDKSVEFITRATAFENHDAKNMYVRTFDDVLKMRKWHDSIRPSCDNVVFVGTPITNELTDGGSCYSKVKATYHIE